MGKACSIIPKTKNGNDSELFRSLNNMAQRETAKTIYAMVRTKTFQDKYKNSLKFDANGEPTIDSINNILRLDDVLKGDMKYINNKYGTKKPFETL